MKLRKRAAINGGDPRGNSSNRRARKLWLLKTFGIGTHAPCVHCGEQQTYETMQVDRIIEGGTYRRENVQVSCPTCNHHRSSKIGWVPPRLVGARAEFALVG